MTYDYPETEREAATKIFEAINHEIEFYKIVKPPITMKCC